MAALDQCEPIAHVVSTPSADACSNTTTASVEVPKTAGSRPHFTIRTLRLLLSLDDEEFIHRAYKTGLGRDPDIDGFTYYLKLLRSGREKILILADLCLSKEGRRNQNGITALVAISWLARLRRMPGLRQAIDVLTLPWFFANLLKSTNRLEAKIIGAEMQMRSDIVEIKRSMIAEQAAARMFLEEFRSRLDQLSVDSVKTLESSTRLAAAVPVSIEDAKAAVEKMQEGLRQLIVEQVGGTVTEISNEAAAISQGVAASSKALHTALSVLQSDISHQVQESSARLAAVPVRIEDAKAAVLARFALGEQMQEQLRQRLNLHATGTASLISKQADMIAIGQANLSCQIQESSTRLAAAVSVSIEDAKAAVEKMQEGLRQLIVEQVGGTVTEISNEAAAISQGVAASSKALHTALSVLQADILHQVQEQLRQRLNLHATGTASLISEQTDMIAIGQANLSRQIQESSTRLAAVPVSIEDAKAAVLARFALGEQTQEQLRNGVERYVASSDGSLNAIQEFIKRTGPQVNRIELYSMTTARRIAVRCGSNAMLVRTSVGYILCPDDDHALIATLIESGELEQGTRQLIQRLLKPGNTFVDVGANVGMHAIAALQAMKGEGHVVAFEPYQPTADLLSKTVWMNGFSKCVEIVPAAAAETSGLRNLYLGTTCGHHSLYPLSDQPVKNCAKIKVKTITVDSVMADKQPVTLMKIDVEGAELEVLEGAKGTIESNPEMGLIVEFGASHLRRIGASTDDWLTRFSRLGFQFRSIDPSNGLLAEIANEELEKQESVNLFLARPSSPLWQMNVSKT